MHKSCQDTSGYLTSSARADGALGITTRPRPPSIMVMELVIASAFVDVV